MVKYYVKSPYHRDPADVKAHKVVAEAVALNGYRMLSCRVPHCAIVTDDDGNAIKLASAAVADSYARLDRHLQSQASSDPALFIVDSNSGAITLNTAHPHYNNVAKQLAQLLVAGVRLGDPDVLGEVGRQQGRLPGQNVFIDPAQTPPRLVKIDAGSTSLSSHALATWTAPTQELRDGLSSLLSGNEFQARHLHCFRVFNCLADEKFTPILQKAVVDNLAVSDADLLSTIPAGPKYTEITASIAENLKKSTAALQAVAQQHELQCSDRRRVRCRQIAEVNACYFEAAEETAVGGDHVDVEVANSNYLQQSVSFKKVGMLSRSKHTKQLWRNINRRSNKKDYWSHVGAVVSDFLRTEIAQGHNVFTREHKAHDAALDLLAMAQCRGFRRSLSDKSAQQQAKAINGLLIPNEVTRSVSDANIQQAKHDVADLVLRTFTSVEQSQRSHARLALQKFSQLSAGEHSNPASVRVLSVMRFYRPYVCQTNSEQRSYVTDMQQRRDLFAKVDELKATKVVDTLAADANGYNGGRLFSCLKTTGNKRLKAILEQSTTSANEKLVLVYNLVNQRLSKKKWLRSASTTVRYTQIKNQLDQLIKPHNQPQAVVEVAPSSPEQGLHRHS